MNEEEYNRMMQEQALAGQTAETSTKQMQQQYYMEEQEKGMIKEQLDLTDEIKRMTFLLRGYCEEYDINSQQVKWVQPISSDMVILTEYGINLILNSLGFYVNKNTLLSNYDEKTILTKMRDFSSSLKSTFFMEYNKIFRQATFEECKLEIERRINKRVDIREFALKILGKESNREEIKNEVLKEMEGIIEKEFYKVKEILEHGRHTRFLLLMRCIQDTVHSTYNRAYMGMERKTLREHIHVAETRGGVPVQQSKGGIFSWLKG